MSPAATTTAAHIGRLFYFRRCVRYKVPFGETQSNVDKDGIMEWFPHPMNSIPTKGAFMRQAVTASLLVIFVFVLSACMPIEDPAATQPEAAPQPTAIVIKLPDDVPRISLDDAKQHFDNGTAIFIDSRYAEDYEQAHIAGAISLPDSAMLFIQGNLQEALDNLENELPKDQLIITYCT